MNNNNNSKALALLLAQEIQWVERLNVLLEEEKALLITRQFEKLDALAQEKQTLSDQLEASALKRASIQGSLDSLNDFLKNATSIEAQELKQLSLKLTQRLELCRSLNVINGQVIATNLHLRQEIVNLLTGKDDTASTVYSSKGTLETSSKTQHHQEA